LSVRRANRGHTNYSPIDAALAKDGGQRAIHLVDYVLHQIVDIVNRTRRFECEAAKLNSLPNGDPSGQIFWLSDALTFCNNQAQSP
jgi:hypothetical protein